MLILEGDYSTEILRELKSKISSQSKKNFVLEKDVRYLDSRIALLIQNRMALEEVCRISCPVNTIATERVSSKTKWPAISKTQPTYRRAHFLTTTKRRNMVIFCSCYNLSLGILHTYADWSLCPRSTRCCRQLCLLYMETSMKVEKNISS